MRPGISTLPGGNLTSRHSFYSCSWRGLAASKLYAPTPTRNTKSIISLNGTSNMWGRSSFPNRYDTEFSPSAVP
jgi:hypothetical protein